VRSPSPRPGVSWLPNNVPKPITMREKTLSTMETSIYLPFPVFCRPRSTARMPMAAIRLPRPHPRPGSRDNGPAASSAGLAQKTGKTDIIEIMGRLELIRPLLAETGQEQ